MSIYYIDESGDLSFNYDAKDTSRFFVLTAVLCNDRNTADRVVKKAWQSFDKKTREKRRGLTLHATNEKNSTKKRFLKLFANSVATSTSITLDKYNHLQLMGEDKKELYTYLIYEALVSSGVDPSDEIIISRRETKKTLNEKMVLDLQNLLGNSGQKIRVKIHHTTPGLQLADFVAHAVFRKYEKHDPVLYNEIHKKDKALAAFAEYHPVPLQQGTYSSYLKYTKSIRKGQAT